jgi:hypothetical protein
VPFKNKGAGSGIDLITSRESVTTMEASGDRSKEWQPLKKQVGGMHNGRTGYDSINRRRSPSGLEVHFY